MDYKNLPYKYHYITFGDIRRLEKDHPVFQKASSKFLLEEDCPDITDDFPSYFYLINVENQIICSVKALPDFLWLEERKYFWAWFGALFTEDAYRGRGFAKTLIQEVRRTLNEKNIAWGGVFSNDAALHIYKSLGFSIPGYAQRYLMFKSLSPFMEAHIRSKSIVRILDKLLSPVFETIFKLFYMKKSKNVNSEIVELNKNEKDNLNKVFAKRCYTNKYHFNDSLEKITWKINVSNSQPNANCSLYLIKEINGLNPIAYFVIKTKHQINPIRKYKDFNKMTLMEYGLFKNDERIYSILLREVITIFWNSEAKVLEVISNSELFNSIMAHMGMIKIGKGMSFTFSIPERWNLPAEYNELRNWHLTHFCGDGFSF